MNAVKYSYITKKALGYGMIVVEGRRADGSLLFGYRDMDSAFWHADARRYVPTGYIPVFQPNQPAKLRSS